MAKCVECDRKLNSSVYILVERNDRRLVWKSCPKCSKINGIRHEFKLLVELSSDSRPIREVSDFGFTFSRESEANPLGSQSVCGVCRKGTRSRVPGLIKEQIQGNEIQFGTWTEIQAHI